MSCWLCGNEKDNAHHLGCMRIAVPDLTPEVAIEAGLMPAPKGEKKPPKPKTEVLKDGSMTTVPVDEEPEEASTCEYDGCTNPKFSDSPRAKYCEEHRDPKNRKE